MELIENPAAEVTTFVHTDSVKMTSSVDYEKLPDFSQKITLSSKSQLHMTNVATRMAQKESMRQTKFLRAQMLLVCAEYDLLPEMDQIIKENVLKPKKLKGTWCVAQHAQVAGARKMKHEQELHVEIVKYYKLLGFNKKWVSSTEDFGVAESKYGGGLKSQYSPDQAPMTGNTLFGLLKMCAPIYDDKTNTGEAVVANQSNTVDFMVSLPHHTPELMLKMKECIEQANKCNELEHKVAICTMQCTFWEIYGRMLRSIEEQERRAEFDEENEAEEAYNV